MWVHSTELPSRALFGILCWSVITHPKQAARCRDCLLLFIVAQSSSIWCTIIYSTNKLVYSQLLAPLCQCGSVHSLIQRLIFLLFVAHLIFGHKRDFQGLLLALQLASSDTWKCSGHQTRCWGSGSVAYKTSTLILLWPQLIAALKDSRCWIYWKVGSLLHLHPHVVQLKKNQWTQVRKLSTNMPAGGPSSILGTTQFPKASYFFLLPFFFFSFWFVLWHTQQCSEVFVALYSIITHGRTQRTIWILGVESR